MGGGLFRILLGVTSWRSRGSGRCRLLAKFLGLASGGVKRPHENHGERSLIFVDILLVQILNGSAAMVDAAVVAVSVAAAGGLSEVTLSNPAVDDISAGSRVKPVVDNRIRSTPPTMRNHQFDVYSNWRRRLFHAAILATAVLPAYSFLVASTNARVAGRRRYANNAHGRTWLSPRIATSGENEAIASIHNGYQSIPPGLLVTEVSDRGDFEQLGNKFSELVFLDGDLQDEDGKGGGDPEDGEEVTPPVCRVVTRSDSKLPTSKEVLPTSIFRGGLLRRLDDIYHAVSYGQTRKLKYGNPDQEGDGTLGEEEMMAVTRASLEDAGFHPLSRRDLDLCEALNAGYLLRLSILPDVSELDPNLAKEFYPDRFDEDGNPIDGAEEILFDGRVLVFWRGYSEEVSRGRLLLPKLDYLQASIVQRSAAWLRSRLNVFERWLLIQGSKASQAARRNVIKLGATLLEKFSNVQKAAKLWEKIRSNEAVELNSTSWKNFMPTSSGKIFKLARYGGTRIRFVGSPNPTVRLILGTSDSSVLFACKNKFP